MDIKGAHHIGNLDRQAVPYLQALLTQCKRFWRGVCNKAALLNLTTRAQPQAQDLLCLLILHVPGFIIHWPCFSLCLLS